MSEEDCNKWLSEFLWAITKIFGIILIMIFGFKGIWFALSLDMRDLVRKGYALLPNSAMCSNASDHMLAMLGLILTIFLGAAVFLAVIAYKNIKHKLEVDFLNKEENKHLKKEEFDKINENITSLMRKRAGDGKFGDGEAEEKLESLEKEIVNVPEDKGKDVNPVLPPDESVNKQFSTKNNKNKGGKT